ncbi:hypothetical protein [Flavobacterium cerinum]|uniref:TldD/PmbA family protein n=1 Tax=Flavobacterium cerinum TaxID=2502784 RepID=A0ABY5IV94_9FLAO|nr:hypothetical protein [Flavobacterium cerinum]UUC46720.1 hypothetical protein NOX80_05850 [Flavobacterium cerinum]
MSQKKIFRKDNLQTKSLVKASKEVAINAVRQSKALDLTITYIENDAIYEEHPDGTVTLKKRVEKKETPILLTKGMIFHAK